MSIWDFFSNSESKVFLRLFFLPCHLDLINLLLVHLLIFFHYYFTSTSHLLESHSFNRIYWIPSKTTEKFLCFFRISLWRPIWYEGKITYMKYIFAVGLVRVQLYVACLHYKIWFKVESALRWCEREVVATSSTLCCCSITLPWPKKKRWRWTQRNKESFMKISAITASATAFHKLFLFIISENIKKELEETEWHEFNIAKKQSQFSSFFYFAEKGNIK